MEDTKIESRSEFILSLASAWLKSSSEYRLAYNIKSVQDCRCVAEEVAAGFVSPDFLDSLDQYEFEF